MAGLNASVDDVDASTLACTIVVAIGCAALGAVRNATKTPRSTALLNDAIDMHHGVLLNVIDLRHSKFNNHIH
jgi:hypothetical protein